MEKANKFLADTNKLVGSGVSTIETIAKLVKTERSEKILGQRGGQGFVKLNYTH